MNQRTEPHIFLNELLDGFETSALPKLEIHGISSDSRQVKSGHLFFACQGAKKDRAQFIEDATNCGAVAVVVDAKEAGDYSTEVPLIAVESLPEKLGLIAAKYFAYPSRKMTLIGITGTNGKTSCSHLLAQCLDLQGTTCGVIGTMGFGFFGKLSALTNTTPGAVELQDNLYQLQQQNAACVAMEVSSHGLEQGRTTGCDFDIAVFTNLSQDHLDYHGTMESYGAAKLKLFNDESLQAVVVNLDDNFSEKVLAAVPESVTTIGISLSSQDEYATDKFIYGRIVDRTLKGTEVAIESSWGHAQFSTMLLGEFNVYNILLVLAVALQQKFSLSQCESTLKELHAPSGRMESFTGKNNALVVVDYAHTPDALEKALQTLHKHTQGDLWVLFGCGGDRDSTKRPLMGKVAEIYADHVWLTNDNPRTESPSQIIQDILQGFKAPDSVVIETSREKAIQQIVLAAATDDIVLIAGKGHEEYQIVGDKVLPFSDREIVSRLLKEAA